MQTIPSTFYAYAGSLAGRGITDPLANIYAGVNYALHRYGASMLAGGGNHRGSAYVGYRSGTNFVPEDGFAYLHRGEAIVPTAKNQGAPYKAPSFTVHVQIGNETIEATAVRVVDDALGSVHDSIHYGVS